MRHQVITLRFLYRLKKESTASCGATFRTMTTRSRPAKRRKLGHVHRLLGGALPRSRRSPPPPQRPQRRFLRKRKKKRPRSWQTEAKKRPEAARGKHTSQFLCHNKSLCGQVCSRNTAGDFTYGTSAIRIWEETLARGAAQHGRVLHSGSTRVSSFSRRRLITARPRYVTRTEVPLRPPQSLGGVERRRSDP